MIAGSSRNAIKHEESIYLTGCHILSLLVKPKACTFYEVDHKFESVKKCGTYEG